MTAPMSEREELLAREIVTEWLGMFDPPPQIDFQQSEFLQAGIAAALSGAHAQCTQGSGDDENRMEKISALIARLQSVLNRWGDTCVYIRRGGLSWGAVALNHQDDDRKHGVFDLQAQHDRDMEQRVGQVERLIADRNRWMERAMAAEAAALCAPEADKAEVVAWQRRWISADDVFGWELVSEPFFNQLEDDQKNGLGDGYELRKLYTSPAVDAGIAAPPAGSADAVREIVDDMVAAWCNVLPDSDAEDRPRQHEGAFRADCTRLVNAALSTAPVTGADAGMRERAAKVAEDASKEQSSRLVEIVCDQVATSIRALALSPEAGTPHVTSTDLCDGGQRS